MNRRLLGALLLLVGAAWWFSTWRSRPPAPSSAHVPESQPEAPRSVSMPPSQPPVSRPQNPAEDDPEPASIARAIQSASLPSGKEGRPLLPPRQRPAPAPAARWSEYRTGHTVSGATGPFDLLSLRAVRAESFDPDWGPKIDEKDGFVLFEPSGAAFPPNSHGVVARKSNGMIGFVCGVFLAQLTDLGEAPAVSSRYNLILKTTDADLGLASFQAPPGTDLPRMLLSLRHDPRIERVDLEIITSFKRL